MRTNLKSEAYFQKRIREGEDSRAEIEARLLNGTVSPVRVPDVKVYLTDISFNRLFARYSYGVPLPDLMEDYTHTVNSAYQSWDDRFIALTSRKNKGDVVFVLESYYNILFLLSLGIFLDADEDIYRKIDAIIKRSKVSDGIFDFIISYKLNTVPDWNESYGESNHINYVYGNLKNAIKSETKAESEKFLAMHMDGWYKRNKSAVWYNSHKSDLATFYGYWSFETAAIVRIKGLDDAVFADNPHYPKALFE